MNYFYAFCGKKIVWGYFRYHHMIEYFQMNIHYSIPVYPGQSILKKIQSLAIQSQFVNQCNPLFNNFVIPV
jgi:hypothetical protein